MSRGRLVFIAGTRPDLIKTGPVVAECRRMGIPMSLVLTGQHTTLLDGCPAVEDWAGARSLGLVGHPDPLHYVTRATAALQDELDAIRREAGPIACVVVQGDTGTALAGARAAASLRLPVAHIEAGLRSHCRTDPWPEEEFRIEIDRLAHWHFCPTPQNVQNLEAEKISGTHVYLTGNPVVAAMARYATVEPCREPEPRILITMHRREWLQQGAAHVRLTMQALFAAAREHPETIFHWPVHPSLETLVGPLVDQWIVAGTPETWPAPIVPENLRLVNPIPYHEAIEILRKSLGLITDSGGLTEEALTLGVPTVVLRNHMDRPEAVAAGNAGLQPPTPQGMANAVHILTAGPIARRPNPTFGTPHSAPTIASLLAQLT